MSNDPRPGPEYIIAVCGGVRGMQGSSVVDFILRDGIFKARALTRDVESAKAVELTEKGVQVVYADFDKPETLAYAFEGVYGVFAVTNFFEHGDEKREILQGINIVDAARKADVKHFVWSALEDTPMIASCRTKAEVQRYLAKSGLPHTKIYLSFYLQNLFVAGLSRLPDNTWDFHWPCPTDEAFPFMVPSDVGGWVTALFMDPEEWIGKDVKVCSAIVSIREIVKVLHDVGGLDIQLHDRTMEQFLALKDEFLDREGWELIHWLLTDGRDRDLALSKRLHGGMKDVRGWALEYFGEADVPRQMPQFEVLMSFETVSDITV
ncbi:NAD(P)-binding protein [Exidia glandulosa HHB12029]|uniref:NAD(P)-binding protein n=1 Tax=Exidia glandulosa HHB12029 TaxID=1314781 RepID=A0A165CA99_EXIGL|nr:NAD(P)-binding protein [Exidia glandulosa HHB12029]